MGRKHIPLLDELYDYSGVIGIRCDSQRILKWMEIDARVEVCYIGDDHKLKL